MADVVKPSLLKQLAGALIGMTAALALYMGYKTTSPLVTAYILPPGVTDPAMMPQGVAGSAILEDSEKYNRLGARTREIAERLSAADENSEAVAPAAYSEMEVHAAAVPEPEDEPAAASLTADDLQWNAQERRERRELTASLTASPVQARPAAPAAPSTSTTAAVTGAEEDAMHGGAPNLPSSGRATNALALCLALTATAMLHRGTRAQLLAWARAVR